jgi:hypothetical protein
MMKKSVLKKWFEMAKDDQLVIDPADINHEARANMWRFSPSENELQDITTEGVAAFIRQIFEARRKQPESALMVFYCWHDFQVSQLCFSLVSRSHDRLPFSCTLEETDQILIFADRVVNRDWHSKNYMHAMPEPDDLQQPSDFVLPIFIANIA